MERYWKVLLCVFGCIPLIEYLTNRLTRPSFINDSMSSALLLLLRFTLIGIMVLGLLVFNQIKNLSKTESILFIGLICLFLPMVLAGFFGYVPSSNYSLVGLIVIFLLITFIKKPSRVVIENYFIIIGRFYLYSGLIFFIIARNLVAQTSYDQSYLGLEMRLNGLTNHANTLGVILSVYFLMEFFSSNIAKRTKIINLSICLLALFLTQSKTAWLMIAFLVVLKLFYFVKKNIRKRIILMYFSIFSFTTGFLLLILYLTRIPSKIVDYVITNRLYEFTGRDVVWNYTLEYANLNKIFGYGLSLWGSDMQQRFLNTYGWTPAHAHSQFYQTLGDSGIVGLIGLSIYLLVIIIAGCIYFKKTNGLSLGLVLIFVSRGITEPIFLNSFTNISILVHFLLVVYIMSASKEKPKSQIKSETKDQTELPYNNDIKGVQY
ncbi:O-antigen ligase [Terribacillus sp. DMT04]|uniref:O-antigen ligase family protein n=1 Tax=Terribacillus sp. DMT04 TaxID=2850441 RepID=UPI001C2C1E92|nr:O-antigen ligase family protein [Terribacillus sp. DMT04]QXE01058.1 O-antigen ligase family protein [Terribacillus sp. DMT04]